MTVEERLRELFPAAKRTTLKQMVQTGRVRLGEVGGAPIRRLGEEIPAGTELHVLARAPEPPRHRKGDLPIVYEDEDILVINKPPGLLTATVPGEKRPTLHAKVTDYLARTAPRARVGLIHRLDKDARGLLVFSKHEAVYFSLKEQLKDRVMSREYHAVTVGITKPHAGTIQSLLKDNEVEGRVEETTDSRRGDLAVTHYDTVSTLKGVKGQPEKSLLKVRLETGRKHQIRVHLANQGTPIYGDVIYGAAPYNRNPMLLAATRLGFIHPGTGKPVSFELPLPEEFQAAMTRPPVA